MTFTTTPIVSVEPIKISPTLIKIKREGLLKSARRQVGLLPEGTSRREAIRMLDEGRLAAAQTSIGVAARQDPDKIIHAILACEAIAQVFLLDELSL